MTCQIHHRFEQLTNNLLFHIEKNGLEVEFKSYTPSIKTGYAFDNSPLICKLKELTKLDKHCPASWTICCQRSKAILNKH